jgi:hypothetical protein
MNVCKNTYKLYFQRHLERFLSIDFYLIVYIDGYLSVFVFTLLDHTVILQNV